MFGSSEEKRSVETSGAAGNQGKAAQQPTALCITATPTLQSTAPKLSAGKKDKKGKKKARQVKFGKWKSATSDEIKKMKFPLKVDEFTVTRRYDKASPVLFDKCAKSETFPYATVVKRKVVGDSMLQAFMKFTFEDVLITKIQFQEAEVLKETLSMIFRKVTFQYKTQANDGTLNPAGAVFLDYAAKLRDQAGGS